MFSLSETFTNLFDKRLISKAQWPHYTSLPAMPWLSCFGNIHHLQQICRCVCYNLIKTRHNPPCISNPLLVHSSSCSPLRLTWVYLSVFYAHTLWRAIDLHQSSSSTGSVVKSERRPAPYSLIKANSNKTLQARFLTVWTPGFDLQPLGNNLAVCLISIDDHTLLLFDSFDYLASPFFFFMLT